MAGHTSKLAVSQDEHSLPNVTPGHSGYVKGCRCDVCILGARAYNRLRRSVVNAQRRDKITADPARAERERETSRKSAKKRRQDPAVRAKMAAKVRENVRQKQLFLNEIKLERGCADCGYADAAVALDFDHVLGNKVVSLSRACYSSVDAIVEELAKCDVVCANCHRMRTQSRLVHTDLPESCSHRDAKLFVPQDAEQESAVRMLEAAHKAAMDAGLNVMTFLSGNQSSRPRVIGGNGQRQIDRLPPQPHKNNTSGYRGVTWMARLGKWAAQIQYKRRHTHLGVFGDKNEAALAFNAAVSAFGLGDGHLNVVPSASVPAPDASAQIAAKVQALLTAKGMIKGGG